MITTIKIFLVAILSFSFYSCCSNEVKEISDTPREIKSSGQDIQVNRSIVEAEVVDVYLNNTKDFILKAKVKSIAADNSYPGIAVAGETYLLAPAYILNEDSRISPEAQRNLRLFSLANLKPGDNFKAEIYFDKSNGWFIRDILK